MPMKKDDGALLLQMVYFLNEKYTKFVRIGLSTVNGATLYIVSTSGSKGVVELPMDFEMWNSFIEQNASVTQALQTKSKFSVKFENDKDYSFVLTIRNIFGRRHLQIRDEVALKNIMLNDVECKKLFSLVPQISGYMKKLYFSGSQIMRYISTYKDDSDMHIDPPEALVFVWVDRLHEELKPV
jgi:hypothetical protein